jgi:hypothetical protein
MNERIVHARTDRSFEGPGVPLARLLLTCSHHDDEEAKMSSPTPETPPHYEVHFESLFNAGRSFRFPCDEHGRVALERLSERARLSYLRAKELVGRELTAPTVLRAARAC